MASEKEFTRLHIVNDDNKINEFYYTHYHYLSFILNKDLFCDLQMFLNNEIYNIRKLISN